MVQALDYLKETASQTAGPYVHIGLVPGDAGFDIYDHELGRDIAGPKAAGTRITVTGTVTDGTGAPVKDILIEVWQANAAGIYPGTGEVEDGFRGWGRVITDFETGEWAFDSVKPGKITGSNGNEQAPHINLWIVARGINLGLNTRLYFDDETDANAEDFLLQSLEKNGRATTLIAKRSECEGSIVYRFDIRMQGDGETVFLDV